MLTAVPFRRPRRQTRRRITRRVLTLVGVGVVASLSTAAAAGAAVSSTTGAAQSVTAPPSAAVGAYESSTNIRVFTEAQVTLTSTLTVWLASSTGTMSQSTMAAGTCVQSHMVHLDGLGAAAPTLSGSATFTQNIVGLIPINNNVPLVGRPLDVTDALFGAAGTTYPTPGNSGRGIELLTSDSLTYSAAQPKTLNFTLSGDGFDEVRVLTVCDGPPANVPEAPLNVLLPLAGLGVVGVVLFRRRAIFA